MVGLFLVLIAAKFGTVAYFAHVSDDGGLGEIMIAVMMAVQAQLIWTRAQALMAPAAVAA